MFFCVLYWRKYFLNLFAKKLISFAKSVFIIFFYYYFLLVFLLVPQLVFEKKFQNFLVEKLYCFQPQFSRKFLELLCELSFNFLTLFDKKFHFRNLFWKIPLLSAWYLRKYFRRLFKKHLFFKIFYKIYSRKFVPKKSYFRLYHIWEKIILSELVG